MKGYTAIVILRFENLLIVKDETIYEDDISMPTLFDILEGYELGVEWITGTEVNNIEKDVLYRCTFIFNSYRDLEGDYDLTTRVENFRKLVYE